MDNEHVEPASVNLTVRRVNTIRHPVDDPREQAAKYIAEATASRAFDLPWTPETRKTGSFQSPLPILSSPKQAEKGSIQLFQPSPRNAPASTVSPAGYSFGFSPLDAILNSPMYSAGARAFLGSPERMLKGLDTPISKSALFESIFAVTPEHKADSPSQLKSSESKTSQMGPLDVALVKLLRGGAAQEEATDIKKEMVTSNVGVEAKALSFEDLFLDGPSGNLVGQSSMQAPEVPSSSPYPSVCDFSAAGLGTKQDLPQGFSDAVTGMYDQVKSDSDISHGSVLPFSNPTDSGGPGNDPTTKSCHCKKSQCLKLYCDCFAAGLFCANCSCISCLNRPENGATVMERRDQIMSRDPQAFTNKILSRGGAKSGEHKKGCNCKRSNCLKKYCECFQGGVKCGAQCKCLECKNVEDKPGPRGGPAGRKTSRALDFTAEYSLPESVDTKNMPMVWQDLLAPARCSTSLISCSEAPLIQRTEQHGSNKRPRMSFETALSSEPATIAYGSISRAAAAAAAQGVISPPERQASGPMASTPAPPNRGVKPHAANPERLSEHDLEKLVQELEMAKRRVKEEPQGNWPRPAWLSAPKTADAATNSQACKHSPPASPTCSVCLPDARAVITGAVPLPILGKRGLPAAQPNNDINALLSCLQPIRHTAAPSPPLTRPYSGAERPSTPQKASEVTLNGKTSTPTRPTPVFGGTFSPTLAALGCSPFRCSLPNSARGDAARALDALLMSPTCSDFFDPVQMLSSPMCRNAHESMLFGCSTPTRNREIGKLTSGSTSFMPSPQADKIKQAAPLSA